MRIIEIVFEKSSRERKLSRTKKSSLREDLSSISEQMTFLNLLLTILNVNHVNSFLV